MRSAAARGEVADLERARKGCAGERERGGLARLDFYRWWLMAVMVGAGDVPRAH